MNSVYDDEAARRIGAKKDAFFRRLLVSNPMTQKKMLGLIIQELQAMIDNDDSQVLEDYYPSVVRLAREAPFKFMRDAFSQIVATVEEKWPEFSDFKPCRRVSYFIENKDIETIDNNDDEEVNELFRDAFLRTGRVSHLIQLVSWHKSYLKLLHGSYNSIMQSDGSLPLPWRSYIALMAASEYRCDYIADLQQYYFIVNGGDYEWIKGIDYVPPKLFRLHELSSLLAHRPWLIKPHHIAELLSAENEDSWSVSELVHAIIVLCKYHSLCSIALGLGCAEEEDLAIFSDFGEVVAGSDPSRFPFDIASKCESPQTDNASSCGSISDQDMATIERDDCELLKILKSGHEGSETADEEESVEEDEEAGTFEVAENGADYGIASTTQRRKDTLWRFCGGSVIRYADFDVRSAEYNVLHTEDFSWDEHCFSLVKRYFPGDAGQILEDLFNLTGKLTYDYFGSQKDEFVDTSPFRNAVWYYVHRIFGICHDDYDYRFVNIYLNRPTKIFIKKVACTPWKVRKEDFEHFDRTLSPSEKCHVTLIVAEARKQAGLMYGLRAVMQHMR
ncbi:TPA: hypothetical protein N0F65_012129 [Lagenidium giganteum]|uniref:Sestrin n=1 Tax=Lagenidium giganteum TaxID=4803 RepID=A0AAV2YLE6_9STRA|nr:TPA: hypothetical protein N0F65_012129 [Lagenidium giganteum]